MDHPQSLPAWHRYLFAGTHGHVAALDKATGTEVWRTSLPDTGFSVVAMVVEDGRLYCASGGHAFALDPATGAIVWKNALPKLGSGLVYLTTANSNNAEALLTLIAQAQADEAASSGASVAVVT